MIGSPSAVIGIGPLIICRMPTSFSTGMRAPAASASGAKRSKSGCSSSGPKSLRMPSAPHGGDVRLPAADRQRAGLGLDVEVAVRIAQRGQLRRNAVGLVGDEVLVLDGAGRDARAGHRRDLAAPHAGRVDHALGVDLALVGHHRFDAPGARLQPGHAHALRDDHAAGARSRRVGVGQAGRIDVAVAFDPRGADDAVELDQRKELARLPGRHQLDMEAEALGHRRRALEFLPARRRRGEAQAADAMPAGRLSGLRLELAVELGGVAHEAREIAAAAQLSDQSRRVPGGAVRQLQAFQQEHVALAALGEVIGDAAADDPAADDDDAAFSGQGHRPRI